MKKNLDTTILFRWDSQKEDFIRQLAKRRGLSTSAYLRLLLDSFVVKRGFAPSSPSSFPFIQTEFAYVN